MSAFDRYRSNVTGFETLAQKGKNFVPRFFADESATGPYQVKGPVAKLIMTPQVQFINTNIAFDVSNSRSPTGTTIDTFDLTFGGGGASDLTGQDWSSDPLTGNVQYTSTGQFTATLTVTDTTGNRSQPATVTIDIVDVQGISKIYILTDDSGVFVYVPGGTPVTANTGLSGGDLNGNSGRLNPHFKTLPVDQQHYAAVNDNGFIISVDGAGTYTKVTKATLGDPTNTAGDASPPTTNDLDEIAIAFDPQDVRRIYVARFTNATWNASFDPRVYLYWSNNFAETWLSFGVGVL